MKTKYEKPQVLCSRHEPQGWLCRTLVLVVLFLCVLPVQARADMGPKPSVQVQFTGVPEGTQYYGTLLAHPDAYGFPYYTWDYAQQEGVEWEWWATEEELVDLNRVREPFLSYEDPDGFILLNWCCNCTEEDQLVWNYWPPETFKLLLYFPDENRFCVSPVYESYAFDSYYTADLTDYASGGVTLEKDYDYSWELISLAVRVVLTIAVELGLAALVFGWKDRRAFRFLAIVNIVTQLFLNIALNAMHYFSGAAYDYIGVWSLASFRMWPYYGLELLVMLIEGILYATLLPRFSETPKKTWVVVLYTIGANLLSFLVGLWLAVRIPGIF